VKGAIAASSGEQREDYGGIARALSMSEHVPALEAAGFVEVSVESTHGIEEGKHDAVQCAQDGNASSEGRPLIESSAKECEGLGVVEPSLSSLYPLSSLHLSRRTPASKGPLARVFLSVLSVALQRCQVG